MLLKGINSCSMTGTRCVTVKRDENQHTGSIRFVQHNQLTPLYCTFPKFFFSETAIFLEYNLCYWLTNRNCCAFFKTKIVLSFLSLSCLSSEPHILIRVSTHFRHSISRKETPYVLDYDIT